MRDDLWALGERTFEATLRSPAEIRRWTRNLLPAECAARDDCVLLLSELAANAAEHGGGGELTITVVHGDEGLEVKLVHEQPPTGPLGIDSKALDELTLLAKTTDPEEATDLIADLGEAGRGLVVVGLLTQGRTAVHQDDRHTVISAHLDGCTCSSEPSP